MTPPAANLSDDAAQVDRLLPSNGPWTVSVAFALAAGAFFTLTLGPGLTRWVADVSMWMVAAVGLGLGLLILALLEQARWRGRRWVKRAHATARSAAERALIVLDPPASSFTFEGANAAEYLAEVGPTGPRVIVVEMPIDLPLAAPSSEPANLGGARRALPARRRRAALLANLLVTGALMSLCAVLLGVVFVVAEQKPGGIAELLLIHAYVLWAVLTAAVIRFRGGLLPKWPWGAISTPGRVEFYGLFWRGEFTRRDSVLVLRHRPRSFLSEAGLGPHGIAARFVRSDGLTRALHFSDGFSDPALQDLLAHWCREGGAGAGGGEGAAASVAGSR